LYESRSSLSAACKYGMKVKTASKVKPKRVRLFLVHGPFDCPIGM
jgi:hypothetical protein